MKTKLIFTLVAALAGSAIAALQTPLPEFKTDKQLAEWRAEKAVASTNRSHVPEEAAFYTGKPYIESSSGYAFKYRSYNPELARWTSEDPCGFPDGANNNFYAPSPTMEFDALGLFYSGTLYTEAGTDMILWNLLYTAAGPLTTTALNHADGTTPGDWTLTAAEAALVKGSSDYTGTYYPSIQTSLGTPADGPKSIIPGDRFLFSKPQDGYYSFGEAEINASGIVNRSQFGSWEYAATVTLTDVYTFGDYSSAPWYTPTALGYRLQSHGWIKAFNVSGTWSDTWYE
jgi:RHS repeat-associated protein